MQHADVALCETGMRLQSQRMGLYQANQLTDQTLDGRGAGCVTNRRWHTELFRKIVRETVKQLMNFEDFAVQKAERARRWRSELPTQR